LRGESGDPRGGVRRQTTRTRAAAVKANRLPDAFEIARPCSRHFTMSETGPFVDESLWISSIYQQEGASSQSIEALQFARQITIANIMYDLTHKIDARIANIGISSHVRDK
jgi:hypothetical protein